MITYCNEKKKLYTVIAGRLVFEIFLFHSQKITFVFQTLISHLQIQAIALDPCASMLNCGILLCMEKKEAERILSCVMDRLAQERARQGLTLSQLGPLAGVSGSSIGMMEKGKMSPRVVTCLLVADALGLSFGDMFNSVPAKKDGRK
jgi:DNA-binding XRE family transcriptional regulator